MTTTKTKTTARKPAAKKAPAKVVSTGGKLSTAKKPAAKKTAKVVAVRPRGEKWTAAKELLMARGGATKADLFAALKWRSMDAGLLAAKTGLTVTKDEATGHYIGK